MSYTDRHWGMVRVLLWGSLAADDPDALANVLQRTARHEKISVDQLLVVLRRDGRLWSTTPTTDDPIVLLAAAAARNRHGAPVAGAARCVRYLIDRGTLDSDVAAELALCQSNGDTWIRTSITDALKGANGYSEVPGGSVMIGPSERGRRLSAALRTQIAEP